MQDLIQKVTESKIGCRHGSSGKAPASIMHKALDLNHSTTKEKKERNE
jgi:hypothetical protein